MKAFEVLITWVTKHGYRPTEWTRPCLDSVGGWGITPVPLPFSKLNNHLTAAGVRSLASFCLREHRIKQVWSFYFTAAIGLCQEHITLSQKGSGLLWKYNSKTELAGFSKWEQKLNKSQRSKCCNTCLYLSKSRFRSEARVYSPNIIKIALMSKRFFQHRENVFFAF